MSQHLRGMMYAESRAECEKARERCVKQFERLYPKAMAALTGLGADGHLLLLPHTSTGSTCAPPTSSSRPSPLANWATAAKRSERVENATALIWKLLLVAEKTFRRLNAAHLLAAVSAGAKYVDGIPVTSLSERAAAAPECRLHTY